MRGSTTRIGQLDTKCGLLYDARFACETPVRTGFDEGIMSKVCDCCGKKTMFGHNVSHAHNVSNRTFQPNLQKVRIQLEKGGTKRIKICTRCLRSGKVRKAVS